MTPDPDQEWTSASPGGLRAVRVVATVVFLVMTVFAFALFYAGLEARSELTSLATTGLDAHVYWVFSGLWVPLGVLASGLVAMLAWTVTADGLVRRAGYRRLRLAGLACVGFCLLGVVGVATSAPGPFLAFAWPALLALVLTTVVCGLQTVGARLLTPHDLRRPAGTTLG